MNKLNITNMNWIDIYYKHSYFYLGLCTLILIIILGLAIFLKKPKKIFVYISMIPFGLALILHLFGFFIKNNNHPRFEIDSNYKIIQGDSVELSVSIVDNDILDKPLSFDLVSQIFYNRQIKKTSQIQAKEELEKMLSIANNLLSKYNNFDSKLNKLCPDKDSKERFKIGKYYKISGDSYYKILITWKYTKWQIFEYYSIKGHPIEYKHLEEAQETIKYLTQEYITTVVQTTTIES